VVYDVESAVTNILVGHRVPALRDALRDAVLAAPQAAAYPAGFCLLAMAVLMEWDVKGLTYRMDEMNEVRTKLDLIPYAKSSRSMRDQSADADLLSCMRVLTRLSQELAVSSRYALNLIDMVAAAQELHAKYRQSCGQLVVDIASELDHISDQLDIRRLELTGLQRATAVRQAEVAGLIQTVCSSTEARCGVLLLLMAHQVYTLIATQDNSLNFEVATASLALANITRRDSTDMRVLAAATFVFLPGTFVAVSQLHRSSVGMRTDSLLDILQHQLS
jgi:hypothetical protein